MSILSWKGPTWVVESNSRLFEGSLKVKPCIQKPGGVVKTLLEHRKFLHGKGCQALEPAANGSSGVTILKCSKMCGYST